MKNNLSNINKRQFIKKCASVSAGMLILPGVPGLNEMYSTLQAAGRKEAMFQEQTPRGVMCLICPNECVLKEGELSQCNNRKVFRSKLYTLAYGNPCSANVDPIEKKPFFHFLPGTRSFSIATAGCNLVCLNCQNWTISQTSPDKTRNFNLPPDKVVAEAKTKSCDSIAYTYSEPVTFYEFVYDTATIARKAGIKNILVSNGYINPEPLKKLCTVIDAANIDLKSFSDSTYLKLTGGKLQPVLDALKIYLDSGVWLEITNLVVPTWTDKTDEIGKMCKWLSENGFRNVPIHFSRFHPTYKLEQLPPTPVDILKKAAQIASSEGLNYVYTGNVPGNDISNTMCPKCKDTLIVRQGFRVAGNSLKNGKCPGCGTPIDGVWS